MKTEQIKELNIGNWITYGNSGPQQLKLGDFGFLHAHPKEIENYKPIELNEEWLRRCGYEKIKNYKHKDGSITPVIYKNYPFIIEPFRLNEGDSPFTISRIEAGNPYGEYNFIGFIKYIHALQNVHAVLTPSELEIKQTSSTD